MTPDAIKYAAQAVIAMIAVGGAIAYALVAQQHGQSVEPPAWLSLLIGIIGGFFYSQAAHSNGNSAALTTISAAMAARRATDPLEITAPAVTITTDKAP